MLFRRALVEDQRADRSTPVASIELTEAELRLVALALSSVALDPPHGWREDVNDFNRLGNRFARNAAELHRKTAHQNGAAPVPAGPRHDSRQETPA